MGMFKPCIVGTVFNYVLGKNPLKSYSRIKWNRKLCSCAGSMDNNNYSTHAGRSG